MRTRRDDVGGRDVTMALDDDGSGTNPDRASARRVLVTIDVCTKRARARVREVARGPRRHARRRIPPRGRRGETPRGDAREKSEKKGVGFGGGGFRPLGGLWGGHVDDSGGLAGAHWTTVFLDSSDFSRGLCLETRNRLNRNFWCNAVSTRSDFVEVF